MTILFCEAGSRWVAFSNHSTNELWVDRVLFDGKESGIPVGILSPGGAKAAADMFPRKIPGQFTIEFRRGSEDLKQNVSGKEVSALLKSASSTSDLTLHFVYSHRDQFIAKVETRGRDFRPDKTKLWPDENAALFQKHKELLRAAYDGDTAGIRKALQDGAPYFWPDNPASMTPLEWTARWNREETFDELMKDLPPDFSPYSYANCIKLAAQDGHTSILKKLLARPLADKVPQRELQQIFYSACDSVSTPAALEILLDHYPVGVDFRVRDYGHTLLFVAVQGQKTEIVEWLVKHGANKNATLQDGSTPIRWARDERTRKLLSQP